MLGITRSDKYDNSAAFLNGINSYTSGKWRCKPSVLD